MSGIEEYLTTYITDQISDPDRLAQLIDYSTAIPCPACSASRGEPCQGAGAHGDRIVRYMATEFVATYAACDGIEE